MSGLNNNTSFDNHQNSNVLPCLAGSEFQGYEWMDVFLDSHDFGLESNDYSDAVAVGDCALESVDSLDLIKGHLKTNHTYTPVNRDGAPWIPVNWYIKRDQFDLDKRFHYVAKVQPFEAGGYEVTISQFDLEGMANRLDAPRKTGKREKRDQNPNDIISSCNRSKSSVRKKVKSMGCDRLMTFTRRESLPSEFWTRGQWVTAWAKFNRLLKKAGKEFKYVAVTEHHKKGNFHFHAAVAGNVNIKLMRRLWWAICGGDGQGNVDVSFKNHISKAKRLSGVARYISKYITKEMDSSEFNKKRYFSSRHTLINPIRLVLNSDDIGLAFTEFFKSWRGDTGADFEISSFFQFSAAGGAGRPVTSGCWFCLDPLGGVRVASKVTF